MSFNAVKFLEDYNIPHFTEGKNCAPGWINIQCPFHLDTNHGGFNIRTGLYNCWKCGKSSIENVIQELLDINYYEAKNIKEEYEDSMIYKNQLNKEKLIPKNIELPGGSLQKMHIKYLRKRNFNPEYLVKKYGIKGTNFTGKFKYRIIIPIYYKYRLVSYQGRDVTDKQRLRYKALSKEESGFDLGTILYGIDDCKKDYIGIVEGAFDRFRMGDDFVSCLTSNLTDKQIKLLSGFKKVYFLFDPEKEAYMKAKKVSRQLCSLGVKSYIVSLDDNRDPADLTDEEAKDIRKEIGI